MDLTELLAQVIGIYLLVAGVGIFLHPKRIAKALDEGARSYLLPYLDGTLALIFGLLIVLTHNVWDDLTGTIISIIGWVAVVEGVSMLVLSQNVIAKALKTVNAKNWSQGVAILSVVVGAYLVYVGFGLAI